MAVIVNGDGILTGISSLATSLTDITSGRGTVTGVATVGTLQLGAGVSISSPRSQQAAIFTNNTEFFTVDDAGRVGVGTITPNSDAHPENEKKINVGFITAKSIAGDIDARNVVIAGVTTVAGNILPSSDSSIDIGTNAVRFQNVYADTLYGDGSNLTGVTQTTINSNADNRLITGSDTANTLNGESNLTWDGTTLLVNKASGTGVGYLVVQGGTSSGDYGIVQIKSGSTVRGRLVSDASVDAFRIDTAGGASTPFTFHTGSSYTERLRIDSRGDLYLNESSSISSPYSTFNTLSIGNNLILSGYTGGNGGFAGMQQNAYVNSGGSWTKVYDDYAFSIGGDDGAIFFRTAGTGTGSITWSTPLQVTNGGTVKIGGDTANSADLDASNSKLAIKQSANSREDGIYIERSGERRGFYIYMGGALSTSDSLSITTNQLGGYTDVMAIDRGGDIAVGAGDIYFTTAGKGIVLGATSNTDANTLDDYEEGVHTMTQLGSGGGVPLSNAVIRYTKIGSICQVSGMLDVGSSSGSSSVEISLPFTSRADSGTTKGRTVSALMHKYTDVDGGYINIVGYIGQNENYFRIYNVGDNKDWHQLVSGDFNANNAELFFTFVYQTA